MAHHNSAIKRIRTSKAANLRNRQYRAQLRAALRIFRESGSGEARLQNLSAAYGVIDRLVHKGVIHRNNAARKKASLYRLTVKSQTSA